jgi:hypothetical protein
VNRAPDGYRYVQRGKTPSRHGYFLRHMLTCQPCFSRRPLAIIASPRASSVAEAGRRIPNGEISTAKAYFLGVADVVFSCFFSVVCVCCWGSFCCLCYIRLDPKVLVFWMHRKRLVWLTSRSKYNTSLSEVEKRDILKTGRIVTDRLQMCNSTDELQYDYVYDFLYKVVGNPIFNQYVSWHIFTSSCNWCLKDNQNTIPFLCKSGMKSYGDLYAESDTCRRPPMRPRYRKNCRQFFAVELIFTQVICTFWNILKHFHTFVWK